jgi:hypothetical protein
MAANDIQVGGKHYKTKYEHWDWATDIGLSYLEGYASKYLARFGKPGTDPKKDIAKVFHIIEKISERSGQLLERRVKLSLDWVQEQTIAFCEANDIDRVARQVVHDLSYWQTRADLREANKRVQWIMDELEKAQPVPLEDSNKHADRSA